MNKVKYLLYHFIAWGMLLAIVLFIEHRYGLHIKSFIIGICVAVAAEVIDKAERELFE